MQGKNHFGALLMVNELESGPKGTIKDQLVSATGITQELNADNYI